MSGSVVRVAPPAGASQDAAQGPLGLGAGLRGVLRAVALWWLAYDTGGVRVSVLKVRGEISHQLANGGEFATSRRNRWIGSVSDGRETSRSVTVAGDLSGALPSQNRRVTGISIVGRISPGITSSHSIDEGRAAAPDG